MFQFILNGSPVSVEVEGDTPLLWVLRDNLGMTGTKFGCGVASCGACTVHVNGIATRTCVLPVEDVEGLSVTTMEGLANGETLHKVQQAWIKHQVPQCGYCQSGQVMAAAALLNSNSNPSDAEIDAHMTNVCRCGTYQRIRAAIHSAAQA
jgi:isoquinoline 1-oxidoreductase alpha subunit